VPPERHCNSALPITEALPAEKGADFAPLVGMHMKLLERIRANDIPGSTAKVREIFTRVSAAFARE